MSGSAKPNVDGLKLEIIPQVITSSVYAGTNASGLFDGTIPNEWNTVHVCYWNNTDNFIELLIPNKCNIWRCGTVSWANSNALLNILKYNGTSYDNVTDVYPQIVTSIDNTKWEKTIANLPAGQYKFVGKGSGGTNGGGYRLDSEWYVEDLSFVHKYNNNLKYLIKQGDNYYTVQNGQKVLLTSPTNDEEKIALFNNNAVIIQNITPDDLNNLFSDKTNLQILGYIDDNTVVSADLEYNVPEYRPIDKLNNQFQIVKYIPGATLPDIPANLASSDITQIGDTIIWE